MAAKCRHVIITKTLIKSRCPNWRTTVNLVRCKTLDGTIICRLYNDMEVVLRHTVGELYSGRRLNSQTVIGLKSKSI